MRYLAIVLLCGCYSVNPRSAMPEGRASMMIDEIYLAWEADPKLPSAAKCRDTLPHVRLHPITTNEDMKSMCWGNCAPPMCGQPGCERGCVNGCFVSDQSGSMLDPQTHPTVVYWQDQKLRPIMTHELAHWLSWCSGMGLQAGHGIGDIWGAGGFVERVSK